MSIWEIPCRTLIYRICLVPVTHRTNSENHTSSTNVISELMTLGNGWEIRYRKIVLSSPCLWACKIWHTRNLAKKICTALSNICGYIRKEGHQNLRRSGGDYSQNLMKLAGVTRKSFLLVLAERIFDPVAANLTTDSDHCIWMDFWTHAHRVSLLQIFDDKHKKYCHIWYQIKAFTLNNTAD